MTTTEQQQPASQQTDSQVDPSQLEELDEDAEDSRLWKEFDEGEAAANKTGNGHDQAAAGEHHEEEPAPKEKPDETGGEQTGEEAQPGQQAGQEEDIWAGASEDVRAAYRDLEQKFDHYKRSEGGRQAALQRQIDDLKRGVTQQRQTEEDSAAADGGSAEEQATGLLGSEDWKAFSEEYPEIAGPLGKVVGELRQQNTRLERELSAIGDDRRQSALDEQARVLDEAHPDWQTVMADAALTEWLPLQPRHIREAAERNAHEIVDAEEAGDVVARFKAWRESQNGAAEPGGEAAPNKPDSNNAALAGKRQRQLDSATSVRTRTPAAASGIPDDEEGAWKAFERMGL